MQRHAVVIDPYLAASDFADGFRARGVATVGVFSRPQPLESMDWEPGQAAAFAATHFFDGDLDRLVSLIRGYDPICVIAGNEAGVELADAVNAAVAPEQGNAVGSTAARRDKWAQAKALAAAGVPHIRQVCSDDPRVVTDWVQRSGLGNAPLVLKPTKSAGTDSVYLVQPGEDWRPQFDSILGAVNRMGIVNDAVLVMELAEGPEFMVDTCSIDGRHGLVMVSVYGKHNRGHHLGIYDTGDTIPQDDPRSALLFDYVTQVADAIGIRNASGHAEVILTRDGPLLVEMAARFSGSCMQIHQRVSTGDAQIDRAVRHYAGEAVPYDYRMVRPARTVWLSANQAGTLVSAEPLAAIADLPSVRATSLPEAGRWVPSTADVFTAIGWVVLADDDPARIESDYARVREIEAALVFAPDQAYAAAR